MSSMARSVLLAALVVVACAAIPSNAFASDWSEAPPQEVLAAMAGEEEPTWVNPQAQASCPFCVFAATAAVRAALVMRAARAARMAIVAAKAARAAAKTADKVSRATMRKIQAQARTISRRGARWTKRNWQRFGPKVKACLASAAFMDSGKFLVDRVLTRDEWTRYVVWGPRLVPPTETLEIIFPIRFTSGQLVGKAAETAIGCAVGAGFAKKFAKDGPTPK
jgi:hypothetical protein